jgi:DNA-binding PucR family transcriptional regulator
MAGRFATPQEDTVVRGVLRDAADRLKDGLTGLAVRVNGAVTAAVPRLAADADLRRALVRSTEANVADVLVLLGDPELPLDTGVPPEATSFATAVVRRGIDPGDLAHAYMVGQNELWRAWMEAVAQELTGPGLVTALEVSSSRLFGRVDFLVAQLMRHVDRERERWMGGALARRTQFVRMLLNGEDPGVAEASRALGYDLDRWVLAAVLWDADTTDDAAGPHDRLEAQAAVAARAAGAPRALTLAPGAASLWMWVATPEEPDLAQVTTALEAALSERQGIAFGTPGHGLEGFRLGHREALDARRVAELGERGGVLRYDEVEAISLLSGDLERLGHFVRRTLGPLTAGDETTVRLRETLLAWLGEGGNARRAAERLHAHKNTVLYRLQRAQQLLGRPLDDDRGDLELALAAMAQLGPRAAGEER